MANTTPITPGRRRNVFELNEEVWTKNDPRFVAQDMSNFKYHLWDDVASFLVWYEDVEPAAATIASGYEVTSTRL